MMIDSGVDIPAVSKRAGHSSTLITQMVYTHRLKELEDRNMGKIEKMLDFDEGGDDKDEAINI